MVHDQRDERIQHLSHEVRRLTDELQKTRAELKRANAIVADLAYQKFEPDAEPAAEASAE